MAKSLLVTAILSSVPTASAINIHAVLNDTAYPVLAVTGFWQVPDVRKNDGALSSMSHELPVNLKPVMKLEVPFVTFGDGTGIMQMKSVRGGVKPDIVEAIDQDTMDLPPCATHREELFGEGQAAQFSDAKDAMGTGAMVPSVAMGCIWSGKFVMLSKAARRHKGYEYYAWLDVGVHADRYDVVQRKDQGPWPNPAKLAQLPKDKISISRTGSCSECELNNFTTCHCLSPTTIIVPGSMVGDVADTYFNKLAQCMRNTTSPRYVCLSEQVILTHMMLENPDMFNVVGTGEDRMFHDLTSSLFAGGRSDLFDWLATPKGKTIQLFHPSE